MTDSNPNRELDRFAGTLRYAIDALKSLQKPDGHFCGELQGDSILESEYILMKFILGQENEPMANGQPGQETLLKLAKYLRHTQRDDGGWGQFPGSPIDLSATVKAYFVLKLLGDDTSDSHMTRAKNAILDCGGAEHCTSFTNFYLACLGQISWNAVPAIPPEIMLLPRWSYFHLSKVSAWTRTMIVPLSLVTTLRPTRHLPPEMGIDELFVDNVVRHRLKNKANAPKFWSVIFQSLDRVLKMMHALGGTPLRKLAIQRAEQWLLERAGQDGESSTDGLGAIFPPMVYIQIALQALGYHREHPVIQRAELELDDLFIEDGDAIRIQPCFSPVWDTGIALYALTDAGMTSHDEPVERAADWLRSKESTHLGDWAETIGWNSQSAERRLGCWYFEYNNAWYPDCDDTAMVAMALMRAGGKENIAAAKRAAQWLFAMQNDDGGWAAFDKTKHRQLLEYIPFADHNAMQDPSCPDITGRTLECLSWLGYDASHQSVDLAIQYIKRTQEPEGRWFGRWGVNYIYGTWQAVVGPIKCGVDPNEQWIRNAGRWIKSIQKPDGSFGESANSYEDRTQIGKGPSTASQTAWAAMILLEIFGRDDPDLFRALKWLAESQLTAEHASDEEFNPDGDPPGSWVEPWFTGTGFPRVFYLRYHFYRLYFPIMAIARYLAAHDVSWREQTAIEVVSNEVVTIQ